MRKSPSSRYYEVKQAVGAKTPPTDARELSLLALLERKPCSDATVEYAYDLYRNTEHRVVIDAFLLAKASPGLVSQTLGIPVAVIEAYAYLFMDVSFLRDRLELLSYANEYEGPFASREIIRTAVTIGVSYLIWAYGGNAENVDPRVIIRHTMIDSFFRGMAHKGNSLTSSMAREAQKWWGTAVRNAELLERVDPQVTKAAVDELRIALVDKDDTLPATAAPVPLADILH